MQINRVLTDGDFDGVASASLIMRIFDVEDLEHCTHQAISDGDVEARDDDAVLDLPYVEGCGLWFDHHASNAPPDDYRGQFDPDSQSAARVIFEYYRTLPEHHLIQDMSGVVRAADKVDSARYSRQDIANPDGPIMLDYIIRSNFDDYSAEQISYMVADALARTGDCYSALKDDKIARLADAFRARRQRAKTLLREHTERHQDVIVLDQRGIEDETAQEILRVNKYLPYVIHEDAHTLLHVHQPDEERARIKLGFNIFMDPNEHLPTDYGALLKQFGGGGHARAAGCTVKPGDVEQAAEQIVREVTDRDVQKAKNPLTVNE